jgi:hypothetical protein
VNLINSGVRSCRLQLLVREQGRIKSCFLTDARLGIKVRFLGASRRIVLGLVVQFLVGTAVGEIVQFSIVRHFPFSL